MSTPDTSDIRTYIGPYPPSRPWDSRTFIWSVCLQCDWYACHLEDQQSMQHTIETFDHARSECPKQGQIALVAREIASWRARPQQLAPSLPRPRTTRRRTTSWVPGDVLMHAGAPSVQERALPLPD